MAPSSARPVGNGHDFVFLLRKGCKLLGAARDFGEAEGGPDASCRTGGWWFDLTPVDFAAQAICELAIGAPAAAVGRVMHVQNGARAVRASAVFDHTRGATGAAARGLEGDAARGDGGQRAGRH
jgi:hypothetical protein